eukprot:scaffold2261_cov405-Prasinococcus_capsulatus_cf.AAC.17
MEPASWPHPRARPACTFARANGRAKRPKPRPPPTGAGSAPVADDAAPAQPKINLRLIRRIRLRMR